MNMIDYFPADDLDSAPVKPSKGGKGRKVVQYAHREDEHVAHGSRGLLTTAEQARTFMLAGSATVTFKSLASGSHYTYKLSRPVDATDDVIFVGVLTGADNETSYSYLGLIRRGVFFHGRRVPKPRDIAANAPSAVAFKWGYEHIARGTMPVQLQVWHEGRCGKCGRKLTHPDSIANGIGPECANNMGL